MNFCPPTASDCLPCSSLHSHRSVVRIRSLWGAILLLCGLLSPLAAEESAFRLIVTANQAIVDGDFSVDLQMRTAEASPSPRWLHSLTLDVYHGSALAAYSDTCAVNWALGPGYEASVSKLAGYYRVLVTANGVSGSDAAWSVTSDWQRLVTLRWKIAAVSGSYKVAMLQDTDAAAYFIDAPPAELEEWHTMPKASSEILLTGRLFLGGSYSIANHTMTTTLNEAGFLGTASPYTEDARELAAVPATITDWILLQLRSTDTGAAVASKSVMLRSDGQIVADDGTTTQVTIYSIEGDKDYFLVAKHRNHIGVMSATVFPMNGVTAASFDFTTSLSQYYGGDAKRLEQAIYGLYPGDANGNGYVDPPDYRVVKTNGGNNGYDRADVNMNSFVDPLDYGVIKANGGANSNIP